MKNTLLFAPIAMIGLTFASLQLLAVDLRASDPIPPVPPGNSLPPPQAPTSAPAPQTGSAAQPLSPGSGAQAAGKHGQRLKKLKNELGLTPDQIARIRPIVENSRQQIQALRSNTTLPPKQRHQQIEQIRVSSFQQIRPILTPQQLQKWKQIREQRHNLSERT